MWQLRSNNLDKEKLLLEESLFNVGNGYIGVRGCFEEEPELFTNTIRGSYINGYFERIPILYSEAAYGFPKEQDKQPRIMDTQTALIFLDNERVIFDKAKISEYHRTLDLKKGYSERGYKYRTINGKTADIIFRRLASFTAKNIVAYELDIKYEGDIEIISVVDSDVSNYTDKNDPRVASGHNRLLDSTRLYTKESLAICEMQTFNSQIPILAVVEYTCNAEAEYSLSHKIEDLKIYTSIKGKRHVNLNKKCVFIDGRRSASLLEDAMSILEAHRKFNFDAFIKQQEKYLNSFWEKSDIEIFGNDDIQEAIRFQLFQLLQSVGKDEISNISAKGLSGEGYEGHYFWDTEIYVLPLFQLTQPAIAKQLLLYRYHILPEAKNRAKELGHKKGAAYPWRTISGIECSSYFPAGTAQYHINADIAYGFIQYHLYHHDMDFMLNAAAEVIFETARIWLEIGHWYNSAYYIDGVTGPDEYTAIVNNNYYTNAMAKYHMYWACKLYYELKDYNINKLKSLCNKIRLTEAEISAMRNASDKMYLAYDRDLEIYAQDDSFLKKAVWDFEGTREDQYPLLLNFHPLTIYRYQVLKQADVVLAHFLLEDYAEWDIIKNSYDYYEKITTHDSSLSSCVYGIMASKCGYIDKAYNYFLESVRLDLDNKHGNTKDGLHIANMAGCSLSIINGFAGYRIKENGIFLSPVLPSGIDGYCFKINYMDSWLEISVEDKIKITLLAGRPIDIRVYDTDYTIEDKIVLKRRQ